MPSAKIHKTPQSGPLPSARTSGSIRVASMRPARHLALARRRKPSSGHSTSSYSVRSSSTVSTPCVGTSDRTVRSGSSTRARSSVTCPRRPNTRSTRICYPRISRIEPGAAELKTISCALCPYEFLSVCRRPGSCAPVSAPVDAVKRFDRTVVEPFLRRGRVITPTFATWRESGRVLATLVADDAARARRVPTHHGQDDIMLALSCGRPGITVGPRRTPTRLHPASPDRGVRLRGAVARHRIW